MNAPFYYLSVETVVPSDAVHVVIGGSIKVVPRGALSFTFVGRQSLERVELQEGVEEIGAFAFARCPNLARVDSTSLITIGEGAFFMCGRLSEVHLMEGLRRIEARAFHDCGLRRITVPSSVVEIGDNAFAECGRLSEVNLLEGVQEIGARVFSNCWALERINVPSSVVGIGNSAFIGCLRLLEVNLLEGLRWIGEEAFSGCNLRCIAVPSSVVEIGTEAFAGCFDLEAVALAGGMALVGPGAFFNCPRLERITIPSMAIVVKDGEDSSQAVEVTGGIERDPSLLVEENDDFSSDVDEEPELEPAQLILTSSYLALMSQEDRTKFADAINELIDDQTQGAGPLDLGVEGVADPIRDCFANCLTEYKTGVAAVVELALWKANMNLRREASRRAAGGGKRARADAPSRDACRCTCGADVVVGPVLSYLWGPHRRAGGEEENRGSIQL